jgi:cytoskeletal protein RodZ
VIVDFIENLQKKPKHIRWQILWLAVVVCMLIIFALWIFSLKYSLQKSAEQESKSIIPEEVSNSVQEMQEQWKERQENIKSNLPNVFEGQGNQKSPFENEE